MKERTINALDNWISEVIRALDRLGVNHIMTSTGVDQLKLSEATHELGLALGEEEVT